jgi:beta-glucosidase
VPRPIRELKGFAKVRLQPGEMQQVKVPLTARAFAFFDAAAQVWRIEAGTFDISVGWSAADLPLTAEVTREAEVLPL